MRNKTEVQMLWDAYLSEEHDEGEERALEAAFICPVCGNALEENTCLDGLFDDSDYDCPEVRKECPVCEWYGDPYYGC